MISSRILGYQWLIGAGLLIVSAVPLPASGEQGRGGGGSAPTFEELSSGFCYLHKKPVKEAFWLSGKFYKSSKRYCDAQGGVLLHREDCALRDPTYNKSLCLRVEDNDNMKKLLTEYEDREYIREQRENARGMESRRQEKISKAVHYLNVLGYYKGTSTSIFVIKPAIDKFVESTGVDMNSTFGFNEAIVRDKSGLRTVSDKLLNALQYETLKKNADQALTTTNKADEKARLSEIDDQTEEKKGGEEVDDADPLVGVWKTSFVSFDKKHQGEIFLAVKSKDDGRYEALTWSDTVLLEKGIDGKWQGRKKCGGIGESGPFQTLFFLVIVDNKITQVISGIEKYTSTKIGNWGISIKGNYFSGTRKYFSYRGKASINAAGYLVLKGMRGPRSCLITLQRASAYPKLVKGSVTRLTLSRQSKEKIRWEAGTELLFLPSQLSSSHGGERQGYLIYEAGGEKPLLTARGFLPGRELSFVPAFSKEWQALRSIPSQYSAAFADMFAPPSDTASSAGAEKIWCATKFEVTQQSSEHYCTTMRGSAYTVLAQAEAEHKRLKAVSTAPSSGSEIVWCATKYSVRRITQHSCNASRGKTHSTEQQARAEHRRLKATSTTTASSSSSAEYKRLKAAFKVVWCATKNAVSRISRYSCNLYAGKVFDSESQAKAEYKRLKAAFTALSSGSGTLVWCGKGFKKSCSDASKSSKAEAEYKRLRAALTSTASSSTSKMVWCADYYSVKWESEYSCRYRGGKPFTARYSADAEHNRIKGGSTSTASSSIATDQVIGLQKALAFFGLYKGSIDGDLGPNTQKAINQWLKKRDRSSEEISPILIAEITADAKAEKTRIAKVEEEKQRQIAAAKKAEEEKKKAERAKAEEIARQKEQEKRQQQIVAARSELLKEIVSARNLIGNYPDYPQKSDFEKVTNEAIAILALSDLEVIRAQKATLGAAIQAVADYRDRQVALAEAKKKEEAERQLAAAREAEAKRKAEKEKQRQIAAAKEAEEEKKKAEKTKAKEIARQKEQSENDSSNLAALALEPMDKVYEVPKITNIRAAPQVLSKRVGRVAAGKALTILAKVSGESWYLVETDQGQRGFVFADAITLVSEEKKSAAKIKNPAIPNIDFGKYYALVIGNNTYRELPDLQSAVNDARAVGALLEHQYGFEVELLTNATRSEIFGSLASMRRRVGSDDNVLIYYAGHGYLDEEANEGYWMPVDAEEDSPSNWLSSANLTSEIRRSKAKHILVVADSCFSGTLTRGLTIKSRTPDYLERIVTKKARTALTSGGLEPVMDSGGSSNHSVFAAAFLSILNDNVAVLDGHQLFTLVRKKVIMGSEQTPEYGDIRRAGHDGGDFLFVKQ